MEIRLDNGVSATEVANLGIRIVSSSDKYLKDVLGEDLDAVLGLNIARTAFEIRALNDIFQDPSREGLWKEDAFFAAKEITEACWILFSDVEISLDRSLDEKPPWQSALWNVEGLSARCECMKDVLKVLRAVLEISRRDTDMPKRWARRIGWLLHESYTSIGKYEELRIVDEGSDMPEQREYGISVESLKTKINASGPGPSTDFSSASAPQTHLRRAVQTQAQKVNDVQEGRQTSASTSEIEDGDTNSTPDLDKCVHHARTLLNCIEELRMGSEPQSSKSLSAQYTKIRKMLDDLILESEDGKAPASRRQSFQMAPVKAYLRKAKFSWKEWTVLSPSTKNRGGDTVPELHEGNECPFPGCKAHAKLPKESLKPEIAGDKHERTKKQMSAEPANVPSDAVVSPGEESDPSARFLSITPGPHPNVSFTTIYTDEDDSSSCRSCSSSESVSSFCVVGEDASKGQGPSVAKGPPPLVMAALPDCMRRMPKSAQDALRLWTTLLD